jgi:hypothetical protein
LTHITSRIASFEGNGIGSGQIDATPNANVGEEYGIDNNFINELTGNQSFISSAVESIMKNTNLSDMVNEIEPIKAENRELRSLLLSQQEMMNGMNSLLFKLLNTVHHTVGSPSDDCNIDAGRVDVVAVNSESIREVELAEHVNETISIPDAVHVTANAEEQQQQQHQQHQQQDREPTPDGELESQQQLDMQNEIQHT